ncbi:MAG TPA: hypothetical protein PKZ02_02240 [Candidatus Paceibacterota bacterium]|nr:hypothetical protein [Candidatus Paceibacterota bacterium]HRZ51524.1 hypothetical protein [Candidatus Paceibacterota bacterium]HSA37251.1 hypothetical protein [Candidatus Paceibacterota bacterium]
MVRRLKKTISALTRFITGTIVALSVAVVTGYFGKLIVFTAACGRGSAYAIEEKTAFLELGGSAVIILLAVFCADHICKLALCRLMPVETNQWGEPIPD